MLADLDGQSWPRVAVIILNWNGWQDTVDLLESLNATTYEPLLVIVIDNNSTDNLSILEIKSWLTLNADPYSMYKHLSNTSIPERLSLSQEWQNGKHFLLVESSYNLGFCTGNNLGMQCAALLGVEYLLILNNDTVVSSNFLEPMVNSARTTANVGLVGGVITYCDSPDIIWWAGGSFDPFLNTKRLFDKRHLRELPQERVVETEWVSGCMMLVPSSIYKQFGGFPEEYFIWAEEWDYSLLVKRAGFRHIVVQESRICHKVGRSLGIMKPLNYYYGLRNTLMFKRKYLPHYKWYPYLGYYIANRIIRFGHFMMQGRKDLARAGAAAMLDFVLGKSGIWH